MYLPPQWLNLTNNLFPEILRIVEGETQGGSNATTRSRALKRRCVSRVSGLYVALMAGFRRSLLKRAENETTRYTPSALPCGDSKDLGNITMTDMFDSDIISASRNVSHMCTFMLQRVQQKIDLHLCLNPSRFYVAVPNIHLLFLARARGGAIRRTLQQDSR